MINFIRKIILYIMNINVLNFINDKTFIKLKYYMMTQKKLNLDNPRSFNEKLQWLKLYDRKPEYTDMVDKYKVKEYISKKIGKEYIIPTISVYEKFDDIDFKKLPNKFVIKCNHDSGGLVICKDKKNFDINAARKKINTHLKRKYYYVHREWPYKNVKPLIIIEKFMEDKKKNDIIDYKFFCFNGKTKLLYVSEKSHQKNAKMQFLDLNYQPLSCSRKDYKKYDIIPEKPRNFNKMIEFSNLISKDIPHVRVDWYEIDGKLYFGEITFYTCSGYVPFEQELWNYKLGDMIELSKKKLK